jgi:hypothetical protein
LVQWRFPENNDAQEHRMDFPSAIPVGLTWLAAGAAGALALAALVRMLEAVLDLEAR